MAISSYVVTLTSNPHLNMSSAPKGRTPMLQTSFHNKDVHDLWRCLHSYDYYSMASLIRLDQIGFTKGRQASNVTRHILNIISYAKRTQMPSLLLSIDAEKAFDWVHWGYMVHTLKKFGFYDPILSSILALYSCPSAQVY